MRRLSDPLSDCAVVLFECQIDMQEHLRDTWLIDGIDVASETNGEFILSTYFYARR